MKLPPLADGDTRNMVNEFSQTTFLDPLAVRNNYFERNSQSVLSSPNKNVLKVKRLLNATSQNNPYDRWVNSRVSMTEINSQMTASLMTVGESFKKY